MFVILLFWIFLNFRGFSYEDRRPSSLGSIWSVVSYYRVVFEVYFVSIVQFCFWDEYYVGGFFLY